MPSILPITNFIYNYKVNGASYYKAGDINRFDTINGVILNYGVDSIRWFIFYIKTNDSDIDYSVKCCCDDDNNFEVVFGGGNDSPVPLIIQIFNFSAVMDLLCKMSIVKKYIVPLINPPFYLTQT